MTVFAGSIDLPNRLGRGIDRSGSIAAARQLGLDWKTRTESDE